MLEEKPSDDNNFNRFRVLAGFKEPTRGEAEVISNERV